MRPCLTRSRCSRSSIPPWSPTGGPWYSGRNVASYKFALAESLLEIAPTGQTSIDLEELAVPFSKHLCRHIATSPRQATSRSSAFLDTCRAYNEGTATYQDLIDVTVAKGFNNVIDAFHVVNRAPIPVKFYRKDYAQRHKRIVLTDEVNSLRAARSPRACAYPRLAPLPCFLCLP